MNINISNSKILTTKTYSKLQESRSLDRCEWYVWQCDICTSTDRQVRGSVRVCDPVSVVSRQRSSTL